MLQHFHQATNFAITTSYIDISERQPQHVWHGLGWRDTLARLNSFFDVVKTLPQKIVPYRKRTPSYPPKK